MTHRIANIVIQQACPEGMIIIGTHPPHMMLKTFLLSSIQLLLTISSALPVTLSEEDVGTLLR